MPTRSGSDITATSLMQEIADHQGVVADLMAREERYRNLIESSLLGIMIHQDSKPLFVNQTWAAIHGYTIEEVLAMDSCIPLIVPEDQQYLLAYYHAHLQGEETPRFTNIAAFEKTVPRSG